MPFTGKVLSKKTSSHFSENAGFTLIELIIVIGVIGVLAGGLLIIINPIAQIQKAHDAQRKSDLHQIKLLLEQYYNDHQKYPTAGSCAYGSNCYAWSSGGPACASGCSGITSVGGPGWIPALVPSYTNRLPVDPINNAPYCDDNGDYCYGYGNVSSDGQHYDLFTLLENANDPQRCGLQDYMNLLGSYPQHWCRAYGGQESNLMYAVDQ